MLAGARTSAARRGAGYDAAFLRERAHQARWLQAELQLGD
jgi:hypothetical protein